MWTTIRIRKHLQKLGDKPFSSRLFLNYGSRSAVDQAIWRLVKKGEIIRVARGLFIKEGAPRPTLTSIAQAKAEAFGKVISKRDLISLSVLESDRLEFVCTGRTTSFRVDNKIIKLKEEAFRVRALGEDSIAQIIRKLWQSGKEMCDRETVLAVKRSLNREERRLLNCYFDRMPGWLAKYFVHTEAKSNFAVSQSVRSLSAHASELEKLDGQPDSQNLSDE